MRPLQVLIPIVLVAFAAAPVRAQDEARRAAAFVEKGNELLSKGKYQDALSAYDEAKIAKPDSAEVAYDRGIALYRLKEFEKAEKAFQGALQPERPDIEAKAKFNLGRCAHEAAIAHVDKLDQAVGELGRAISFYGDALQLNAKDMDAQENMAAAERLRAYLQKKLEEQKQKKQSPSSQPDQEPTSQPQQQQPSSQPSSQPQDQEGEEGDKKDEQQDSQDQQDSKDQKQKGGQKEQKGGKQDQQSEGEPQDEQPQNQDSEQKPGDEKQQQAQMSKEQTEAMLQEARDMEHQRREAKRARMMRIRGRAPVQKDW